MSDRARRARLDAFAHEHAGHTPPGVMLVAVLRAAGRSLPSRLVRVAVATSLPDAAPREWGRDINHALASGLVVEEGDEWRIGPRADAITTPADGPHMAAARDALDEARLTLRLASLPAR
jgi:hypothetical protein